jgi:hypothetical protein
VNLSLEALRAEFDQSFAQAPSPPAVVDDYLAVRAGGMTHALALTQIQSLHRDKKIVRLLTPRPHRLGVASFRGVIAPVFDLRTLLGFSVSGPTRWLVLTRGPCPIGLAFDTFEHYLRLPRGAGPEASVGRPIVDLTPILGALEKER